MMVDKAELVELIRRFSMFDEASCEAEAVALGQNEESGLPILAALLAADDLDVRFWAVRGLWANGSAEAVKLLIETLDDESEMVRSATAYALGELKAAAAVEALTRRLSDDPSDSGAHAADALAKIGQPAAPALIGALRHEQSWARVRAAKALVPVESRPAITALFYALEDESYLVRHYAEEALARMGVGQMVYFRV
jgi:HEAT repeat protein